MSTTLNLLASLEGGEKDTPRFDAILGDINERARKALLALLDIGESPDQGDWEEDCQMDVVRCGISFQVSVPIHGFRGDRCCGDSKGWIASDVRLGGSLIVKGGEGYWIELNHREQRIVSDFIDDALSQAAECEQNNRDWDRDR